MRGGELFRQLRDLVDVAEDTGTVTVSKCLLQNVPGHCSSRSAPVFPAPLPALFFG